MTNENCNIHPLHRHHIEDQTNYLHSVDLVSTRIRPFRRSARGVTGGFGHRKAETGVVESQRQCTLGESAFDMNENHDLRICREKVFLSDAHEMHPTTSMTSA